MASARTGLDLPPFRLHFWRNFGTPVISQASSPASKIQLFRSLFRGRTDVYPVRLENRKTGKAGYAPTCANEWVRGVCEKPKIKCADCSNRRFLQVTDEVIRRHLSGEGERGRDFVIGVYPMLLDETCCFFWPPILTRKIGGKTHLPSSPHAAGSPFRPHWNDHVPATVRMFGSSLKRRFRQLLRESSARIC